MAQLDRWVDTVVRSSLDSKCLLRGMPSFGDSGSDFIGSSTEYNIQLQSAAVLLRVYDRSRR